MADPFSSSPKDKFTFGLWTVGNAGRDPFGEPTRARLTPAEIVDLLGEAGGVHGVNFHDNDLVPIDATPAEATHVKEEFSKALKRTKLKVAMATTNLFGDPVFKDGAFTSNDAEVRAYAIHKTMRGMDLGAEFGAKIYVFWGGREGTETDAAKDPIEAEARFRSAMNFCVSIRSAAATTTSSRWKPSPTSRGATCTFATTGTTWPSSRRSSIPIWSV
jgi:xylose isomerase